MAKMFIKNKEDGLKSKEKLRPTACNKFKLRLTRFLLYPYTHLFILRFLLFHQVSRYNCFESLILLAWLIHSLLFQSDKGFFGTSKFLWIPLQWLIFLISYMLNIDFLWSETIYKIENMRFGVFKFDYPFLELGLQFFVFFYACIVMWLQIWYEKV